MTYRVSCSAPRHRAALLVSALAAIASGSFGPSQPAQAGSLPAEVSAQYKITLNGFDVGSFQYTSAVEGNVYTLSSDVELSLLLGAFNWKGVSRTVGLVNGSTALPSGFNFDFTSTMKSGAVRIGFDRGAVKSVTVDPPMPPSPDLVPVKEQQLKGVLDPLTAVMALTLGGSGSPCARKVSIFDGRQRFDLQLVHRRQEPMADGKSATVCMIKYVPIGGYKANADTANMAGNTGIEITFRSVEGANLNVPQRVVLPTLAGTAEITAERVEIRTPGKGQLALVN